jgi:hypothetical protein
MKLVWDNGKQVPPAKNTKSHSRHYVASGEDAFAITYHDTLRLGVLNMGVPNMKQWCDNYHTEVLMQNFFKEVGVDPQ